MSDGRDNVTDRVASRFDGNDSDSDEDAQNSQRVKNDKNDKKAKSVMNAKNIKNKWKAKTVYLPDELHDEMGTAYKRLDLELDDEFEELRKTRHYYPLLIAAGLERLEEMESKEIIERLEGIDPDLNQYLTE